jgi:purine-cytosine permease-like protein
MNISNRLKISRILSFGATCFGIAVSWCSCAADFNTYFPEDTSQFKIFLFTYIGNSLSFIPIQLLGASVYIGTFTNQNWAYAYQMNNVGGLLGAMVYRLLVFLVKFC